MEEKKYKRACEIKSELSKLYQHKEQIEKSKISDVNFKDKLYFRFSDNMPYFQFIPEFVPSDMYTIYKGLINSRIAELNNEFNAL